MMTSIVRGARAAIGNPKLVLVLWGWSLVLGLAAAIPARGWFAGALNTRVETNSLLAGFNFGTFADLSKYSEVAPFSFLIASMVGAALIALVGSAFMNGGMVEVLGRRRDARPFMHRFHRGGGRLFWRFVRLGLFAFLGLAIVVGLLAALMRKVMVPLSDSEWEPAGMVFGLVVVSLGGLVALWFILALDYARVRVALDDSRGMWRVYRGAMGFVVRHFLATYGLAILGLVAMGALLAAYVAYETVGTASTWTAILGLLAVQQLIVVARTGLRVVLVATEREYFLTSLVPRPVETPATPTEMGNPAAEAPNP